MCLSSPGIFAGAASPISSAWLHPFLGANGEGDILPVLPAEADYYRIKGMKAAQDGRGVVEREAAIVRRHKPPDPALGDHPHLTLPVIDPLNGPPDRIHLLSFRLSEKLPTPVSVR
jgi:hypothetical protein